MIIHSVRRLVRRADADRHARPASLVIRRLPHPRWKKTTLDLESRFFRLSFLRGAF
jgi:hypothetical protein